MAELVAYPTARITGAWNLGTPTLGGVAGSFVDAINDVATDEWLELGQVSNNVFDVFEVNLTTLPVDALITSARMEFGYRKNSQGAFRLVPLAISADGLTLTYGSTEVYVYGEWDTDLVVEHPYRFSLSDGSFFSDHSRLGFYIKHINGENDVADTHRLQWARLRIQYDTSGPVAALTQPVDASSIAALDTIEWTYTQPDGRPQTHYQAKVFPISEVAEAPDEGADVFDSGRVSSSNGRLISPGLSLDAGDYRVYLKVWSTSTAGGATESAWDDHDFTITVPGSPLNNPEDVTATFIEATGRVDIQIAPDIDTAGNIVEIQRSEGGGEFETIAKLTNPGWTAGTRFTVSFTDDPEFHKLVVYRVRNSPVDNSASSDWVSPAVLNTQSSVWWMIDSANPVVRLNPRVQSYNVVQKRVTSKTQLRDRAVVATTGPLSDEIQLTVLTLNTAERVALETMLDLPRPIRLVDIIGKEWYVEIDADVASSMQRLKPLPSETTGLRDAHLFSVSFVEVADPN